MLILPSFRAKLISGSPGQWAAEQKSFGRRIVATNGCFDLLHIGHVDFLEQARLLGDCLIVAINSDSSVRALKGISRPIIPEMDRLQLIASLGMVSAVWLMDSQRADGFLAEAKPDIWVKGSDYNLDTINKDEKQAAVRAGTSIQFLPFRAQVSTSKIINRILAVAA